MNTHKQAYANQYSYPILNPDTPFSILYRCLQTTNVREHQTNEAMEREKYIKLKNCYQDED